MNKMSRGILQIVTLLLTLLPILIGCIFWDRLPARIPVHFDSAGNASRYAGKLLGIVQVPVTMALLHSLFIVRMRRKKDAEELQIKSALLWFCPVISNIVTLTYLRKAVNDSVNVKMVSVFMIGVFSIVMGFYFIKLKPGCILGIKTPWTVSDDENWRRTHKLAGKLWIIMGSLVVILAFLNIRISNIVMIWIWVAIVVPVIYSYRNRT